MRTQPLILIIDDEPLNLRLLETILRREGFGTIKAHAGPEGRKVAHEERPDLILLDIMMPGETGFETCLGLKADPVTADIPVIFVSAMGDVDNKVKGLSIGAVDYITKPFDMAEVLARTKLHIKISYMYNAMLTEQAARLAQLRDAQKAILTCPEDEPEAGFAVIFRPFLEAGGDFYDVFRIGGSIFGYFLADVSGHDLGASFVTSALKALIRQNSGPMFTPVETMKMINRVMRSVLSDGQHLTGCYARLNRDRSRLTVVSAAHPPVIYVEADGSVTSAESRGDVLGVFDTVTLASWETGVSKGDRFFLYTDGLIEMDGLRGRAESIVALTRACADTRSLPLARAIEAVVDSLLDGASPRDDVVLLGVEI